MTDSRTPRPSTSASDRVLEALDLRASGLQWDEVAERMGYADESGPSNLVRRYLRTARQEAARYVMELALHRIDVLLVAVWPAAASGDVQAQAAVLRLLDRQAKYLRLDGMGDELAPSPLNDPGVATMMGKPPQERWGHHETEPD